MDALYHKTKLVEVYDAINSSREDFDFYVEELPTAPAEILDIGCGTGTFALALASRGYHVTAVDPAPQMIAKAKQKDAKGSVNWVTGFVSDLAHNIKFDTAVMTGHAFQCLLEDSQVSALFEAVEQRLSANGSFWFETRNPMTKPWLRWTPENASPPIALGNGRSVEVVHKVLEAKGDFVTFEERYNFSDTVRTLASQSTLRFLELDKIKTIATKCGLELSETFGNWKRERLGDESPEIIIQLTKAA